jgi:ketosteroid isomerase-like protein
MGTEDSKRIVLGFFENLNAGNAAAALDALGDSATWWIQGNFPLSGTKTKAQFVELLGELGAAIDGALSLRVKGVTAEGDRVAVEAESFAKMKNGKTYQNRYHFLCEVRDGKIQAVREYLDTMHANEVLCS